MKEMIDLEKECPNFSPYSLQVLREGKILIEGETIEEFVDRVEQAVFSIEEKFGTTQKKQTEEEKKFREFFAKKIITLGSPTLTNAGRNKNQALSSCIAIPVDLREPFSKVKPIIESYYHQNMGSGFNLSNLKDPVKMVKVLNEHAIEKTELGDYERYIGNMANLDIDHPMVSDFVRLKSTDKDIKHFNLSVNVTDDFMRAVQENAEIRLKNGDLIEATKLWDSIIECAWKCGDPGFLFLDRFNEDNPTPSLGEFYTTAPCAEVGLTPGESCVFGYINVGNIIKKIGHVNSKEFDFKLLEKVVEHLTRVLDNCLEVSLSLYPTKQSKIIMAGKRKIGIGICGFADLLIRLRMEYASDESCRLLKDILATMTYVSKKTSIALAQERGSFPSILISKYFTQEAFIENKFITGEKTRISNQKWKQLEDEIKETGSLRNATTTSLPPSGRSALILGASTSIEPLFSLVHHDGTIRESVKEFIIETVEEEKEAIRICKKIESSESASLPNQLKKILRTATEISAEEQIKVVASTVKCIDEGVSKTVNLPFETQKDEIADLIIKSWLSGLKAISIYRDGSKLDQPEKKVKDESNYDWAYSLQ